MIISKIIINILDFKQLHEKNASRSVFMVTSLNPKSGKSFIASNLGICMGFKGSRVLVIDFDFRKATTSTIVGNPQTGVSDYLAGKSVDLEKLIVKSETYDMLDILPVGQTSDFPSDLLANNKIKEMISALRPLFDYILLDCPPIDIVADAALVNKISDATIFVVRTNLFDKSDLPYLQELYDTNVFNDINIVLNNSDGYGKFKSDTYKFNK